ncbi:EVE domain-containing protein [Thalassotalea profundi]|uniref:Ubiquinol-cytochrome c reductase n=1 Tax=Thalassotalea profundi TaxID=2036687 RepID=A0ABQ3IU38_9GAMM|nr:EVE domain-containing protein [Thalassotalea profundi]GHE92956.1 ubiquinol-cytochrome c reductase [Thalassotalea profundi]
MNYWLFKTEPDEFNIDDLEKRGEKGECWEGIRNYQARNFLRDHIKENDLVFIYHSSCKNLGIAGIATVVKAAFPDPFQFNVESKYYDEKSTQVSPRWFAVQIAFKQKITPLITLSSLKEIPQLQSFPLLKKGNRLSVMPVSEEHWKLIEKIYK